MPASQVARAATCGARAPSCVTGATCEACRRVYPSPRQLTLHRRRIPLCAEWLGMPPEARDARRGPSVCPAGGDDEAAAAAAAAATAAAARKGPEPPGVGGRPHFAADGGAPEGAGQPFDGWGGNQAHVHVEQEQEQEPEQEQVQEQEQEQAHVPAGVPRSSLLRQRQQRRYAGFLAPAYSLCHIIWNVFLIDKEFARLPNFRDIVAENRVSCVIAILPDAGQYEALVGERLRGTAPAAGAGAAPVADIVRGVIEYSGHDIDQPLDAAAYDAECARIEAHRRRRGNVFVFCNNGYQRSLPFLAYYLTRFHGDEVPSVERAIDIILPQVDKANYAARRADVVRDCEKALRTAPPGPCTAPADTTYTTHETGSVL